jgi:6-pyruvoyltetrahydropterin/6-carboxytetrahydropterin synthase
MATIIRVTKSFGFEAAHVLSNYDGPCRDVHGHSYKLFVTISGVPSQDEKSPRNGMVIDFSDLKAIVKKEIISVFDHTVVISKYHESEKIDAFIKLFGNTIVVDYQPTCENLVADFAARIIPHLPEGTKLFSLKLFETATSYAEWYASDNVRV